MEGKHYDRLIGTNPDQELLDQLRLEKGSAKIEGLELEKTERELELLDFAEDALDEYLVEFGKERNTRIPRENIHVVEEGGVNKYDKKLAYGLANTPTVLIMVDRIGNEALFTSLAFHEMVHIKSFQSQQHQPDMQIGGIEISMPRRNGMNSFSRQKDEHGNNVVVKYLDGLDEALTSMLERRFYDEKIKNNEMFSEEDRDSVGFSYQRQINFLDNIMDKVIEKNPEPITKEEIIKILMDAKFNGRLLPMARLIKNSLGGEELSRLLSLDREEL